MGELARISGPLIVGKGMRGTTINEVVKVGKQKLLGEIIALQGDEASIQVYEDTSGLKPGDPIEATGAPLQVELGPGLLSTIFDGVQRPLEVIRAQVGDFVTRGIYIPPLDRKKKWAFKPTARKGSKVSPGDVLGTVKEGDLEHKILVPPKTEGTLDKIASEGSFTVEEEIAVVNGKKLTLMQKWSVRAPRPYKEKKRFEIPLISGKRILDTFFPIAKGGAAAIPGGFGTGKTVTQQDLAKYADADIIVFVACGERGNELSEVLTEFPKLVDPKTKKSLMNRTILIANTSNMPVAAREASIYTGVTIAEYYRDMGFDVALMADSTSRWAEAMREISGRMEEMPGEEGYPAYLSRKLAEFYERSGRVDCLGSPARVGSVSIIGAVSPPGGDISEPVSQGTLRITKAFWALDSSLARRRHYPAINWLKSYSLYLDELSDYYAKHVAPDFMPLRAKAMELLQKEAELQAIVQLVGPDALPERERLVLEATKMIREDFLQQHSFEEVDAYSSPQKQYWMLKAIMHYYDKAQAALAMEMPFEKILGIKERQEIAQLKRTRDEGFEKKVSDLMKSIDSSLSAKHA